MGLKRAEIQYNPSSTDGIDYIRKQKPVKVNTERLSDLDRFLFPNGLSVMPVKELK